MGVFLIGMILVCMLVGALAGYIFAYFMGINPTIAMAICAVIGAYIAFSGIGKAKS